MPRLSWDGPCCLWNHRHEIREMGNERTNRHTRSLGQTLTHTHPHTKDYSCTRNILAWISFQNGAPVSHNEAWLLPPSVCFVGHVKFSVHNKWSVVIYICHIVSVRFWQNKKMIETSLTKGWKLQHDHRSSTTGRTSSWIVEPLFSSWPLEQSRLKLNGCSSSWRL